MEKGLPGISDGPSKRWRLGSPSAGGSPSTSVYRIRNEYVVAVVPLSGETASAVNPGSAVQSRRGGLFTGGVSASRMRPYHAGGTVEGANGHEEFAPESRSSRPCDQLLAAANPMSYAAGITAGTSSNRRGIRNS